MRDKCLASAINTYKRAGDFGAKNGNARLLQEPFDVFPAPAVVETLRGRVGNLRNVPSVPRGIPAALDTLTTLVFNGDFSLNSAAHPGHAGGVIVLFLTGAGPTSPPSLDGQVWQTTGGLQANVSAQIIGPMGGPPPTPASVQYAGPAPGQVAGVEQVNIEIPPGLFPGYDFLYLTIGSQTIGVPVSVR